MDPFQRVCASCGEAAKEGKRLLRCGRCSSVFYCNPACQKAHYAVHKAECKAPQEVPTVREMYTTNVPVPPPLSTEAAADVLRCVEPVSCRMHPFFPILP